MSLSFSTQQKRAAEGWIAELEARKQVSELHVVVGDSENVIWECRLDPETERPVFDLASLTKPAIASLALRLDHAGVLSLHRRVGTMWPQAPAWLRQSTLSSLLRHRSTLPAWLPLYHLCGDASQAPEEVLRPSLKATPVGTYSDLGYLLWGWTAQLVLEKSLAELLEEYLLHPLGMHDTGAAPGPRPEVAVSYLDTSREVELAADHGWKIAALPSPGRGSVQDGNARFLGGVCGHAGLFGTAWDQWRLAAEWLRPGRVLSPTCVQKALGGSGLFALGWSRRRRNNSGGNGLSRHAFGHVGFTGGSCWVDPERDLVVVALAHRRSLSVDLRPWRQTLHAIVADEATR